jgi:hypothetical protein
MTFDFDRWREPGVPIRIDHVALCQEALAEAVDALEQGDKEHAADRLKVVSFEADWARLELAQAEEEKTDAASRARKPKS